MGVGVVVDSTRIQEREGEREERERSERVRERERNNDMPDRCAQAQTWQQWNVLELDAEPAIFCTDSAN